MLRATIYAIAGAAFMVLSAPIPAQSAVANPAATTVAPAGLAQEAQYYRHHRHYGPRGYYWNHRYWAHRRWHCWRTRVYRHGRYYWVRRCGWRYY